MHANVGIAEGSSTLPIHNVEGSVSGNAISAIHSSTVTHSTIASVWQREAGLSSQCKLCN